LGKVTFASSLCPNNADSATYRTRGNLVLDPALTRADEKRPLGLGAALQGHQKMGKRPVDKLDVKNIISFLERDVLNMVMLSSRAIKFV
jgi:hypothetical protein